MVTKTEHELRLDAEEQARADATEVHRRRLEIMRVCPAGRFLDHEHLVTMLGQSPSSNAPWLALAYLAAHGAGAVGVSNAELTGVVGIPPDALARFKARDVWWDPDPELLASLREDLRGRIVGPR